MHSSIFQLQNVQCTSFDSLLNFDLEIVRNVVHTTLPAPHGCCTLHLTFIAKIITLFVLQIYPQRSYFCFFWGVRAAKI